MKKVLLVAYGGGHVRMLLPVARALRDRGLAEPVFLGLTTARAQVLAAGFPCLGFLDFVEAGDAPALAQGRQLACALAQHAVSFEESAAYLGLCYADLEHELGAEQAARRYADQGRQAFLPVRTLQRILRRLRPALVVATSAPRAERAALLAARALGVPSVCLVDLLAAYEIEWLQAPDYADRVCVLNEPVRQRLLAAGRRPQQVVVTGNPAFDPLFDPALRERGAALRRSRGWERRSVWLWASQPEPARHHRSGQAGDPRLPARIAARLQSLTEAHPDLELVIRPHPSEAAGYRIALGERQHLSGPGEDLHTLLAACDGVVVLTSTVGIEARMAGCHVLQVLGSLYSDDAPYQACGIADAAVPLEQLEAALLDLRGRPRQPARGGEPATPRVLAQLEALL